MYRADVIYVNYVEGVMYHNQAASIWEMSRLAGRPNVGALDFIERADNWEQFKRIKAAVKAADTSGD